MGLRHGLPVGPIRWFRQSASQTYQRKPPPPVSPATSRYVKSTIDPVFRSKLTKTLSAQSDRKFALPHRPPMASQETRRVPVFPHQVRYEGLQCLVGFYRCHLLVTHRVLVHELRCSNLVPRDTPHAQHEMKMDLFSSLSSCGPVVGSPGWMPSPLGKSRLMQLVVMPNRGDQSAQETHDIL